MHKYCNIHFVNNTCHYYLNKIFELALHCRIDTRNTFSKLKNPLCKTNMGQKAVSYIGPSIWNGLPDSIKRANSLNTFKHVKKYYLIWITYNVFMWICAFVFIYVYVSVGMYIYAYANILVYFRLTYSFSSSFCFFLSFFFFCFCFFLLTLFLTLGTTIAVRHFCLVCGIPANIDAIHICLQ